MRGCSVVVVVVRWPIHARIGPFTRHTFADQGDRGKGALATAVDCARLRVVRAAKATRGWVLSAVGEWESVAEDGDARMGASGGRLQIWRAVLELAV